MRLRVIYQESYAAKTIEGLNQWSLEKLSSKRTWNSISRVSGFRESTNQSREVFRTCKYHKQWNCRKSRCISRADRDDIYEISLCTGTHHGNFVDNNNASLHSPSRNLAIFHWRTSNNNIGKKSNTSKLHVTSLHKGNKQANQSENFYIGYIFTCLWIYIFFLFQQINICLSE